MQMGGMGLKLLLKKYGRAKTFYAMNMYNSHEIWSEYASGGLLVNQMK